MELNIKLILIFQYSGICMVMVLFLLHNPANAAVFNLTQHLKSIVVVPENNKKGLMPMAMNQFEFFIVSSVPFTWNII